VATTARTLVPLNARLETVLFSSLAICMGLAVAWGSWQATFLISAGLGVLGFCSLCIQSSRSWVYACVAASLAVPAFYPSALNGETPIYASNFILLLGCVMLLLRGGEFRFFADDIQKASLLLLTALLISLPFAYWISGGFEAFQSLLRFLLILQPFFVYFWIRGFGCFENTAQLRQFVKFLLGLGVLAAAYGIVDFYYPIPIPHPFADQYIYLDFKHIRRAQGIFYEASSFGNLCAFLLCLAISLLLWPRRLSVLRRGLLGVAAGIFTMALFLSYSRGSWLAVMVTIPILLLLRRQFKLRILFCLVVILGGFILLVYQLSPDVVVNFFSWRLGNLAEFWDDPDTATSGRWESWMTLIQFFADHLWFLLFGIGYKTISSTDLFGKSVVADNGYLSVLLEAGVLGLAAFCWLNFAILKALRESGHAESPFHQLCRTFLVAFWCGEMIQMLTGDIFTYWRNLTVFFAMIAAVQTVDRVLPSSGTLLLARSTS
jgi:hypothetical protein